MLSVRERERELLSVLWIFDIPLALSSPFARCESRKVANVENTRGKIQSWRFRVRKSKKKIYFRTRCTVGYDTTTLGINDLFDYVIMQEKLHMIIVRKEGEEEPIKVR